MRSAAWRAPTSCPSVSGQLAADTEHNDYEGEPASDDPEFDAKVSLAWELDLWGNLRWANRKAVAEYLATVDAQRALQMTLVAEVATAYYELVALDQELSIVRRTLQTRKEGVRQARLRFEGGLTSETALQQAKVELASTATLIPGLESRIALKEHQIALLAGAYPTLRIDRQTMEMHARLPERLKVGLPSELLKRRPDLRQSEQTLRAAEAAMGMASADRFPRITFSLTGGWENDDLKGLFSSPFSYVGGSLVSPLFSFGKKKAKYKAALAACDEARLNYEQKVLEAFREVNDAVVTYRNVRTAAALKRDLQQAAQKYVELAQLQYFNGVINYLDVLDAQRKYFDAQIGLSNAVRDEHLAMVDLYKALGGGWGVEPRVVPADTDCLSPVRRSAPGRAVLFRDGVHERPAVEKILDILQRSLGDVVHRLGREEGLVRRDDHIGEEQQPRQRVVVDDRVRPVFVEVVAFLLVDVQPRRADLLAFERFDQRFGLDKLSAAGVDDHHAAFHAGDRGLVDEVLRLVGERAVERDDVRTAVELVERDVGDARLAGENAVGVGGRRPELPCRIRAGCG